MNLIFNSLAITLILVISFPFILLFLNIWFDVLIYAFKEIKMSIKELQNTIRKEYQK